MTSRSKRFALVQPDHHRHANSGGDLSDSCFRSGGLLEPGYPFQLTVKNGELEPDQLREVLIMLANYAGYPRAAGLIGVVEQQIAAFAKEQE